MGKLSVNPRANGTLQIPINSGRFSVTVDALRDIEHEYLAYAAWLTLEEFEADICRWAEANIEYDILID